MNWRFSKYQGSGNDFILIDNRTGAFPVDEIQLIAKLCDRRFGIGADGLMCLEEKEGYDFFMRYYNADGREGSMCGNGGRCIVAFAKRLGIIEQEAHFYAADGAHNARIDANIVSLNMQDVTEIEKGESSFYLNTGSPHYVKLVENREGLNTYEAGKAIRYNERFAEEGTNVNFLTIRPNKLIVSTYERGVEDETYSCGTGVVASAIVAGLLTGKNKHQILTKGGTLEVSFDQKECGASNILLKGAAEHIFEGEVTVS